MEEITEIKGTESIKFLPFQKICSEGDFTVTLNTFIYWLPSRTLIAEVNPVLQIP